ncbi:hypothetical protein N9D88_02955 [Alphaproteobacteria bacterium]|nr:hypothetical protein [Alphaproteobacteria bacterium]
MNSIKIFFSWIVFTAIILIICEFSIRIAFTIGSNDMRFLYYSSSNLNIYSVKNFLGRVTDDLDYSMEVVMLEHTYNSDNGDEGTIRTFGGSTTFGYSCGSQNSYPSELQNLGYNVKNYSLKGANSDAQLDILLKTDLNSEDIVLWGNQFNEGDQIYLNSEDYYHRPNLYKNFDVKKNYEENVITGQYGTKLAYSLADRVLFVKYVLKVGERLKKQNNKKLITSTLSRQQKILSDFRYFPSNNRDLEKFFNNPRTGKHSVSALVAEQYYQNLQIALEYTISRGAKFVIVELPVKRNKERFYLRPSDVMRLKKIDSRNAGFISIAKDTYQQREDQFFCDRYHKTTLGNKLTGCALANVIFPEVKHCVN